MAYDYTTGDGLAVLDAAEPDGATETVSILDNAIRQIKAYLKDTTVGPHALINATLPSGIIVATGRSSAPTGWLICDGSAVSRTTYSDLFDAIGTTYGLGDGSTTFNLPNLQRKFPLGKDGSLSLGDTGGVEDVTLTAAQLPELQLSLALKYDGVNAAQEKKLAAWALDGEASEGGQGAWGVDGGNATRDVAINEGAATAHNNMPPYQVVNYMVKI